MPAPDPRYRPDSLPAAQDNSFLVVESVVLPRRTRPAAVVRFLPQSRPTIWGATHLESLERAIASIDQGSVEAVVLAGAPGTFSAGADLRDMSGVATPEEAELVARRAGAPVAVELAIRDSLTGGRGFTLKRAAEAGLVDAVIGATDWDAEWQAWVAGALERCDAGERPQRNGAGILDTATTNRIAADTRAAPAAALRLIVASMDKELTDLADETALTFGQALLGAGLMASQLATLIAQYARVKDLVSGMTDLADVASADFVIEAIFEDLEAKRAVFANVEGHVSPDAILATNTSSLSIDDMAAGLMHPERVVGFHVFNPVGTVPLLEVINGEATSQATLSTTLALATRPRRTPVLVRDSPGFVVNRILTRMFCEILGAVDEGTPASVANHALDSLGTPRCLERLVEHNVRERLDDSGGLTGRALATLDHGHCSTGPVRLNV